MNTIVLPRTRNSISFKPCLVVITGTIFEYYDYALYGFFATLIAQQFFPDNDPTIGLLKTFSVFIAGSLSKPLGALIFSQIGDKEGRSPALKFSLLGIGLPTMIIGLMPSFNEIGWIAPCLLLLCRITQGMFVSGESDGARIFLFETLGPRFYYTASALSGTACMLGIYMASLAASIVVSYHFPDWAWRVPFIVSGILGIFIWWLRNNLLETPEFTNYRATVSGDTASSLREVIAKNKTLVFSAILICGTAGGCYHFYFVFFANYLNSTLTILDSTLSTLYIARAILVFTLSSLLIAMGTDYFGEKIIRQIFKIFMIGLTLMIGINIYYIHQKTMPQWVMLVTAFFMTPVHSVGLVLIYKKLLVSERFRCSSLGHAIGSMLFSGTAPFMSLWLWKITQFPSAPLFYFTALSIMSYFAVMRLTRKIVCRAN